MASSEKFCLRWNDFESNISVAFREIREEKDFFDCTLSCGSRQIQAHKLILSACSPFFRSILRQNPHQHPLLYLKGVEYTDLQSVLNFMYHGEVNVAQEELNSFLAVAEDLKVKGLTQNNTEHSATEKTKPEPSSVAHTRPTIKKDQPPKHPKFAASPSTSTPAPEAFQDDDDIQEVMPVVKQEPSISIGDVLTQSLPVAAMTENYQPTITSHITIPQGNTLAQMEESYEEEEYDYVEYEGEADYDRSMMDTSAAMDSKGLYSSLQDEDSLITSLLVHQGACSYACARCGKTAAQRTDLMKHIVSKHVATPAVNCQFCGKKYKNQNSLQVHISQNHRELWQQAKKM